MRRFCDQAVAGKEGGDPLDGTLLRRTSSVPLHPLSRAFLLSFKGICQEGSARLVPCGGCLCVANSGLVPRDTGDDFLFMLAGSAKDAVIVLCRASLLGDTAVAQQCLVPVLVLASHGMRAIWH